MHEHVSCKIEIALWAKPNPNLTTLISIIKHTSNKCMKHCYNTNEMQCMIIYHQINTTQPKNFTKISKTQKNFEKPQNLGLKCMNA